MRREGKKSGVQAKKFLKVFVLKILVEILFKPVR